jgi:hypothetical protein
VNPLRSGKFDAEEAAVTAKELDLAMAHFQPGTARYRPWTPSGSAALLLWNARSA